MRSRGEIKSLRKNLIILHSICIALHSFKTASRTCESSFVRKGRKAKDSYLQMKKQEL